jgi:hypothetical protein
MPSATPTALGHGHDALDLGIGAGSLVLQVALFAAVPVVTGFALLRGFFAEPGRFAAAAVVATAAGTAALQLVLAGGLNLPRPAVPLLFAALAVPLYLVLSRERRRAGAVGRARRFAPWVFWPVAVVSAVQFALAVFGSAGPKSTAVLVHTGVLLGLVALAWFVVARPQGTAVTVGLRVGAALLATVLIGGVAQAVVSRPAASLPGLATAAKLEIGAETVDVLVVPNLPGWNLVHVGAGSAAVGTDPERLAPASPRPGTAGVWAVLELPAGPSELWVRRGGALDSFSTDTGTGGAAPAELIGPDGLECASALLGRMAGAHAASDTGCSPGTLDPRDAGTLRETVAMMALAGNRRISVIADRTGRGQAADAVVRTAAAERGLIVIPPGDRETPLVVVAGWAAADAASRRVAGGDLPVSGTYLAPWLFTETSSASGETSPGGRRFALRFDPADAQFRRYTADLRDHYPAQTPTAGGYRAWLADRELPEGGRIRLRQAELPWPETPQSRR